ncbi:hypothetical protein THRCLA_00608 [Thraustotheca clavata]|uniref:Secreted protein n=1 Tax=Thraustotheca clavata TaxID=74557 RepID=A0A1W0AB21_9STRA|nr:hypothetical protein THRCLA_00608 [Thraustotheca clavata]
MKCALAIAVAIVGVHATQVSICRDATYDITGSICAGNGNQGTACPRKGDKAVAACHSYLPSYDAASKTCIALEDAVCVQVGPSVYGCSYPSLPCAPAPSTCNETLSVCPSWDYSEQATPSEIQFSAASAPAAWFTSTGSLPEYQVGCLDGSPVTPLTTPTPAPTQPNPTPAATTPAPTPANTTPSPTPASSTPKPTPAATTPAPTPANTTPSPTSAPTTSAPTTAAPTTATPTPTPAATTPNPTPASTQPATAKPTTQAVN